MKKQLQLSLVRLSFFALLWSVFSIQVGQAQTFTSFGSSSTSINSSLVINGTNLIGTSSVKFGETPAKFTLNSSTQITATVPRVANSGPLRITKATGSVLSSAIPVTRQSSSNVFSALSSDFNSLHNNYLFRAPTFTDIDGDGLLDMLTGSSDGAVEHYEQNTANSTSFNLVSNDLGLNAVGTYSKPTFTDLDGDGLLDVLVGESDGTLNHYEQNAANSSSFTLRTGIFNSIDVGNYSAPTFTDLDGDGLLDMIVGEFSGNLNHYEQNAANSDQFTLITDNFNGIDVGGWSAPTFTDLDGDGLLDMVVGEQYGAIWHYEQNAANSTSFNLITANLNGINVNYACTPTFTDLDGDGLLDMLVGRQMGLYHFEQNQSPIISTLSANPICQNATVSITGTDLTGATLVTINGSSVGTLSGITATNITFTVPANATSGNVLVTTPNGTSNAVSLTINALTFTSFGSSSTTMNSSLVINGTNLIGTTSVKFGETPARFTVNSSTQITATVPRVANTGKISLTNSTGCQSLSTSIPVTRQSSSNVFSSITTAFNTIDIGDISAPAITDLDGDGLLDIIIGERYGTLKHYEQNAVNSTSFTLITSSFNGISVGNQSAPTFTDIDGDGLLDMIVGEKDGNLNHYEQNAANSTSFTLISANFNTIDIGDGSSPTFTDLDGDGLLDMIVGELSGNLNHYEQNAANSTSFTLITANFNGIAVGEYSNSTFTDLDGDGLLDLIIGENAGNLNHYEQNATYSNSFTLITDNFNGISVGSQSSPTFTDLDGDGLLDMIIGEFDGNLNHYEQNQSPIISTLSANPTCQNATVSITGTDLTGATLVTINGTSVGSLSGITATNITFTVPANATSGNVVVTTQNGTSNAVSLTINALTFTSFGSSSTSMNSSLVINGTNLIGTSSVKFGETPARFTVNSSTQITATVPRVANSGKVSLTESGCNSNVLSTSIPVTRQSSSNAFSSITESFNVINVGIYSAPTFTDLDGDGLLDMIVGENDGTLNHYEQNTTNSTSFTLITDNFNAINVGSYSAPTFTDLDGDGLLDMIIGEFAGNLNHYEQNAANSTSFTLVTNNFNGIDIGDVSVPTFTDLDGDGLLDMLLGKQSGTLSHYEQNATNSNSFTLITANFNAIDVGFYSTPTFTDLDGDGLLDLFIGEDNGSLNHYEQNAANSASFTLVNINFNGINVGVFNSPAFTDLDGDGLLDMIIGEYGGNLNHYEQNPLPIITSFTPASGSIGTLVTITGTDLNGLSAFTIGGVSAIAVSNTGTTLVGMVMPGAATAAVAVTTAGGSATSAGTFTVLNTPFPIAQQGTKLTGTSPLGSPSQGWSVALSADGKTALVSGYYDNNGAGATWVYTRSGNTWSQQAKLIGTGNTGNAWQGFSVALAADGNTAIIGGVVDTSGKGAVWIFTRSGSTWSQQGNKLVASDEVGNAWFGKSVSLSADGNTALVGGYWDNSNAGAAWVFTRSGTTWTQQGNKMVGTGAVGAAQQGTGVSLSADGNTAAIGGATDDTNKGASWIFTRSGTTWTQQGNKLVGTGATGASKQGQSLALSADATTLMIGGVNATSNVSNAWVYTRSGSTWTQQGTTIVGSDATIGTAANGTNVSLSADGNTAMMGSVSDNGNRGAAWVFTRSANAYAQKGNKLVATGTVGTTLYMGRSVALSADGTNMLVGADGDATGQGAAWSYAIGVTYDGNGNTGGTVAASQLETIGSSVTLATNSGALVKTGHTFAGWNTLANGTETSYAEASAITFNGSLPLYAQWTAITYTITATAGAGGSISPVTALVNAGSTNTYTITPDAGYSISNVTVDDISATALTTGSYAAGGTYVFTDVQANHMINVTFACNYTWTGATSTAWNTPGNWSCGVVPTSISDVTIAAATNQPVLSTNVGIHTLTLAAGTTMKVPTGLNLTVTNYIHNSGTLTLENNANLIQMDDVVNTGNVIVYRDSAPIVRLDHTLWSSPVKDQNLFSFSPATLTNRFYTYDTSSNKYVNTGLDANSTFEIGKGFAVRAPNNQTAVTPTAWQGTFTGVPNNGTIPFVLNASASGYNLVGNPYPSTLDADAFIAANPNITGTLYFYAHSLSMNADGTFPAGTNYATWNSLGSTAATYIVGDVHLVPIPPSGIIQVGQGFFVKATGAGTINFTNTMRVADNDNQSFRTKAIEKDRFWLDLKTETGTNINQILVGYITGATQGVDRNYDGLSFGNTGSYLSSKIAADDYAIQGRSLPFDSSDEVPLGFKAATAGNYSIALSKSDGLFAGNQEVFLKDNLTGITHNIKGSSYSFTSQTGTFDTRFSLVYAKTLGVDANSLNPNSVQVYKEGDWFRVKTNGITMQEVSVYDLAGRLIFKQSGINGTSTLLAGLSQVNEAMLVKIVSQENQSVTVKVIN